MAIHGLECGITSHASGPSILVFRLSFLTQSLPSKNIILINWLNDSVGQSKMLVVGIPKNYILP